LAAGPNTQTVLPFTGLNLPTDVAVDTGGNVYGRRPGQQTGAGVGRGLMHH